MIKKIIVLLIILFLGMFLLGCRKETLPTTTTTTCVDTTTTTEATTTTTEATTTTTESTTSTTTTTTTTTSTTTTTTILQYDMSALEGTILSMTQLNGYLYIATNTNPPQVATSYPINRYVVLAPDAKLYKVSTTNPTVEVASVSVTHNYESMMAGDALTYSSVIFACEKTVGNDYVQMFIYNENLELQLIVDEFGDTLPGGLGIYATDQYASFIGSVFTKYQSDPTFTNAPSGISSHNVSETGIISMEYGNNHFYACNPTTIYKYDPLFGPPTSLAASSLIGGSPDLIGIAYLDPYIWVIDKTTKILYKIPDGLL